MRHCLHLAAALLLAAAHLPAANAHVGTEQYIPIGKSPGVSHAHSYIGQISSGPTEAHTVMIESARGDYSEIRMDERTRIYVDRSKAGKRNLRGDYSDCQPGRRVEVKFRDNDPAKPAEWVKVEVSE